MSIVVYYRKPVSKQFTLVHRIPWATGKCGVIIRKLHIRWGFGFATSTYRCLWDSVSIASNQMKYIFFTKGNVHMSDKFRFARHCNSLAASEQSAYEVATSPSLR